MGLIHELTLYNTELVGWAIPALLSEFGVVQLKYDKHNQFMQCPECESKKIVKNGRQKGKNYLPRDCNRQFIDAYDQRCYSQKVKERWLTLYCNGMGFRGIEPSRVCHNTAIDRLLIVQRPKFK